MEWRKEADNNNNNNKLSSGLWTESWGRVRKLELLVLVLGER